MEHNAHEKASPSGAGARPAPTTLDEALAAAGRTPGSVSHDLRVSREAVWAWRKRGAIPRGDHLCGLADLLGLHPREVLALVVAAQPAAPAAPSAQRELEDLWSGDELGEAA